MCNNELSRLVDCPFCKSEEVAFVREGKMCFIVCGSCGARGPEVTYYEGGPGTLNTSEDARLFSHNMAAQKWNP